MLPCLELGWGFKLQTPHESLLCGSRKTRTAGLCGRWSAGSPGLHGSVTQAVGTLAGAQPPPRGPHACPSLVLALGQHVQGNPSLTVSVLKEGLSLPCSHPDGGSAGHLVLCVPTREHVCMPACAPRVHVPVCAPRVRVPACACACVCACLCVCPMCTCLRVRPVCVPAHACACMCAPCARACACAPCAHACVCTCQALPTHPHGRPQPRPISRKLGSNSSPQGASGSPPRTSVCLKWNYIISTCRDQADIC